MPLSAVDVGTLVWVQPMPMRPAYELWAGESVVATLRYRGLQRREALACAAEGVWTFDVEDPEPTIHLHQRDRRVGAFSPEAGRLRLESGETFLWRPPAPGRAAAFSLRDGRTLVTFASELSQQARLRVDVAAGAELHERITLLALLGCYHLFAEPGHGLRVAPVETPLTVPRPLHRS